MLTKRFYFRPVRQGIFFAKSKRQCDVTHGRAGAERRRK